MSYFSIVCVAVFKENANDTLCLDIDPNVAITLMNDIIYYDFDWLIWYEDYEPINKLHSYLEFLGRENYAFLRVGEMVDDITRLGSPQDFHLDIHTKIVHPPELKMV